MNIAKIKRRIPAIFLALVVLISIISILIVKFNNVPQDNQNFKMSLPIVSTERNFWERIDGLYKPTYVFMKKSDVDDAELDRLANNEYISGLSFENCPNITGKSLEKIATLSNLTSLTFLNCDKLTQADFSLLKKQNKLWKLKINDCDNITDETIASIAEVKSLTDLSLFGCRQITTKGIEPLTTLRLKSFTIPQDFLDDNSVEVLTRFKRLVWLYIGFENDEYPHMRKVAQKGDKDEKGNYRPLIKLTNDGLMKLRELRSLEFLTLASCPQITEDGLRQFVKRNRAQVFNYVDEKEDPVFYIR